MISTNRNEFFTLAVRKASGIAIIAALGAAISLTVIRDARADAPVSVKANPATATVHRMIMTPVWTIKAGSPVISGITAHVTAKHAVPAAKQHFNDFIDTPIWPVTAPEPDPTDTSADPTPTDPTPTNPATGSSSG